MHGISKDAIGRPYIFAALGGDASTRFIDPHLMSPGSI